MILSVEQVLRDTDAKLTDEDKNTLKQEVEKSKEVLNKQDATVEELKAETDRLAQACAPIFQRMYQQAQQSAPQEDGSEVKYDVHDDDKK